MAIRHVKSSVVIEEDDCSLWLRGTQAGEPIIYDKAALGGISADLYNIKYHNLWPLRIDGKTRRDRGSHSQLVSELVFDASRVQFTGENSALPLNYFTRIVRTKSIGEGRNLPKINEIKQHYDGEAQQNHGRL